MIPYIPADIETSGNDPGPSTPPARVLPEHVLSSDNYNHDNSDSAHSRFSATDALVNGDTESNSTSPSPQSLYLKFEALKTTLGKRARAHAPADWSVGPASSTRAAVVPAKKRVRSRGLMRSAPRATVAATPSTLAGNSEFMSFTATIFIIQLGPDGPQFHAHESVLKRSPKLAEEIAKAKANKRATKQNTLPLMAHDAIAFEQMLQFLYKDKFLPSGTTLTPHARLGEFKELMSLAKHYGLPALQEQIVELVSKARIPAKVPPGLFFDWAEDMWHEELDHDDGPFKGYLSKAAPVFIEGADEATMKELLRMVKQGGGFAEQLFIAAITALDTQTNLVAVKKEEMNEPPAPARLHTGKSKGKDPTCPPAREEASDRPEDESMEDNEHLFVENGTHSLFHRNGNIAGPLPSVDTIHR